MYITSYSSDRLEFTSLPTLQLTHTFKSPATLQIIPPSRSRPTLQINFTLDNQQVKLLFKSAHTIHPSVPPFTLTLNQSLATLQTIPPFRSRPTLQVNFQLETSLPTLQIRRRHHPSRPLWIRVNLLFSWLCTFKSPATLQTIPHFRSRPTLQINFTLENQQVKLLFKSAHTIHPSISPALHIDSESESTYSSGQLPTWKESTYSSDPPTPSHPLWIRVNLLFSWLCAFRSPATVQIPLPSYSSDRL